MAYDVQLKYKVGCFACVINRSHIGLTMYKRRRLAIIQEIVVFFFFAYVVVVVVINYFVLCSIMRKGKLLSGS